MPSILKPAKRDARNRKEKTRSRSHGSQANAEAGAEVPRLILKPSKTNENQLKYYYLFLLTCVEKHNVMIIWDYL